YIRMCCSADHSGSIGVSCPTTRIIDKEVSPVCNQGDHDKRSSGQLQSSHRAFLDFLPPCQRLCLVCDDRRFGKPAGKREEKRESDLTIDSRTNLEDSAVLKADTLKPEIVDHRRPPSRHYTIRRNRGRFKALVWTKVRKGVRATNRQSLLV